MIDLLQSLSIIVLAIASIIHTHRERSTMSLYERRADRLSLTMAQRRVIDSDDIGWIGWDSNHLPVIDTVFSEDPMAIDKQGNPVKPQPPIQWRRP